MTQTVTILQKRFVENGLNLICNITDKNNNVIRKSFMVPQNATSQEIIEIIRKDLTSQSEEYTFTL